MLSGRRANQVCRTAQRSAASGASRRPPLTGNRCAPIGGCIVVLCRLTARALPMLLKQFRNSAQRFIHLLSRLELSRHVRFQNDHIGALCIPCRVLSAHTFAEVILWAHFILLVYRRFPSSLLLHNFSVQPVSVVLHLRCEFYLRDLCTIPRAIVHDETCQYR